MKTLGGRRHPFVLRTDEALRGREPDKYGMLRTREKGCLNIRVGPKSVARGLRILNRVLKILERLGHRVVITSEWKPRTMALVGGEEIPFSLWEGSKRTEHLPTKQEQEDLRNHTYRRFDRWEFHPSGDLTLEIGHWGFWGVRTRWADGKRHRLEPQLDGFVQGIQQAAAKAREIRIERERERQSREAEERKRLEERHRQEEEQRRLNELNQQIANWRHMQLVREFVAVIKQTAIQKYGAIEPGDPLDSWMSWASQYANSLDPLDAILRELSTAALIESRLDARPGSFQGAEATEEN